MIFKRNLVLVGMMGSGKSTIGRIIARNLQYDFIDIDNEIEKIEGKTISEIFIKKGEEYFRELEEKVVLYELNSKIKVISLGGGSFINKKIRNNIKKDHFSVWLKWNYDTLIERITKNDKRPLVKKLTKKNLINMIKDRSVIYGEANIKIECENLSKKEIINIILKAYEN